MMKFAWLVANLAVFTFYGCGASPVESDEFDELDALVTGDDCDTTSQCKTKYGASATDCKNSKSTTSVCICGASECASIGSGGAGGSTGGSGGAGATGGSGGAGATGGSGGTGVTNPSWLAYTGSAVWGNGTLTLTSSGRFNFNKPNQQGVIWDVPSTVTKILIKKGVQVTGTFAVKHNVTIEGEDRKTSVVFGTNESSWADSRGLSSIDFATVRVDGSPTVYVKNLTLKDGFGFMIRGGAGSKIHVDRVDFIDTRDGGGNHSDGFVGGDGSTVSNSYFSQGDDAIKVYWGDTTYTNVTINMRQNCVPIQLGWGNYGSGARGTFKNLTITGDNGRNPAGRPVIDGASGSYSKTIVIDGAQIHNPNASLVRLNQNGQKLDLTIGRADIDVATFGPTIKGALDSSICGTSSRTNSYDCD